MVAGTFDHSIGIRRRRGQFTYHIAPNADKERELLIKNLQKKNQLDAIFQVTGVGATLQGCNGDGDWHYTDGEVTVGVIAKDNRKDASVIE